MKNFLLGATVMLLFAFSSPQMQRVVTVPAKPKATVVKVWSKSELDMDEIQHYIQAGVKDGYIVKSVSVAQGGVMNERIGKAILIMEKY
jgi:hypothetical protein